MKITRTPNKPHHMLNGVGLAVTREDGSKRGPVLIPPLTFRIEERHPGRESKIYVSRRRGGKNGSARTQVPVKALKHRNRSRLYGGGPQSRRIGKPSGDTSSAHSDKSEFSALKKRL